MTMLKVTTTTMTTRVTTMIITTTITKTLASTFFNFDDRNFIGVVLGKDPE